MPPDVVAELRERGLFRPVSTLTDPRLSYPEQFLMQDWDRETDGAVSIYRKTGEGCSQSVEFGAGRWRRITSDLGDRKHIVEMSPTGQSRQWLESAALPELDRGLSATRPLFDAFMQTGASAPEPLDQERVRALVGERDQIARGLLLHQERRGVDLPHDPRGPLGEARQLGEERGTIGERAHPTSNPCSRSLAGSFARRSGSR